MESAGTPFPDPLVRLAPAPAHRTTETGEHPARVAVEAPAAIQAPGGTPRSLPDAVVPVRATSPLRRCRRARGARARLAAWRAAASPCRPPPPLGSQGRKEHAG